MAFFNEFPHTRFYDADLGWIIKKIGTLLQGYETIDVWKTKHEDEYETLARKVEGLINNLVDVIVPWDSSIAYHVFSIVEYQGTNYIAVKDVPVGTMITNTEYWQPANTVTEQLNAIAVIVSELQTDFEFVQLNRGGSMEVTADIVPGCGVVYDVVVEGQLHHFRRAHEAQSYYTNSMRQFIDEETPDPYGYTALINCALTGPYMFDGEYEGTWPSNEALYYMGINDANHVTLLSLMNGDPTESQIRAAGNNGGCIWGYIVKDGAAYQPTAAELAWTVGNVTLGQTYGDNIWNWKCSQRSVLGFDRDERIHFICSDARRPAMPGFTCPELAAWLVAHGIVEAYSMDGGGNQNLWTGKRRIGMTSNPTNRVAYTYLYVE